MKPNKEISYKKSSFSGDYNCVGVAVLDNKILMTNTKQKDHCVEFAKAEWDAFIKGVKTGEFDNID